MLSTCESDELVGKTRLDGHNILKKIAIISDDKAVGIVNDSYSLIVLKNLAQMFMETAFCGFMKRVRLAIKLFLIA